MRAIVHLITLVAWIAVHVLGRWCAGAETQRWWREASAPTATATPTPLSGRNVVIGIGDTGLDADSCFVRDDDHPIGPTHRKIVGLRRFASVATDDSEDPDLSLLPQPDEKHGTHVVGTALGNAYPYNPGLALTADGVAPEAKVAFTDLSADGNGSLGLAPVAADLGTYLRWAYDLGARIHNDSWGTRDNLYSFVSRDIDAFVWKVLDMLPVFSAGNDGNTRSTSRSATLGAPANAKNILSVGSTRGPGIRKRVRRSLFPSPETFFSFGALIPEQPAANPEGIRLLSPFTLEERELRLLPADYGGGWDRLRGEELTLGFPQPPTGCVVVNEEDDDDQEDSRRLKAAPGWPDLANTLLVVVRGECDFVEKARAAQAVGARAIVIFNDVTSGSSYFHIASPLNDGVEVEDIKIPIAAIPWRSGDILYRAGGMAKLTGEALRERAAGAGEDRELEAAEIRQSPSVQPSTPSECPGVPLEVARPVLHGLLVSNPTMIVEATGRAHLAAGHARVRLVGPRPLVSYDDSPADYISDFSAHGPTMPDGRVKPDVLAPGENVLAAKASRRSGPSCETERLTGTSMAAPFAAGAAALAYQYLQEQRHAGRGESNPSLSHYRPSAALLKAVLINGAEGLKGGSGLSGLPVEYPPSFRQGWGKVEVATSFPHERNPKETRRLFAFDDAVLDVVASGAEQTYCLRIPDEMGEEEVLPKVTWATGASDTGTAVDVDSAIWTAIQSFFVDTKGDGQPPTTSSVSSTTTIIRVAGRGGAGGVKATLVWSDAAGDDLQNDLDLTIVTPQNDFSRNDIDCPTRTDIGVDWGSARRPDYQNNVEKGRIPRPLAGGAYLLRVRGVSVPSPPPAHASRGQPYSLVVTAPRGSDMCWCGDEDCDCQKGCPGGGVGVEGRRRWVLDTFHP